MKCEAIIYFTEDGCLGYDDGIEKKEAHHA